MTLKNRILVDKSIFPLSALIGCMSLALVDYFRDNHYLIVIPVLVWTIGTVIHLLTHKPNYLIELSSDKDSIRLVYQRNFGSKKDVHLLKESIKESKLKKRLLNFEFDRLSIKYIDSEELYNRIDFKVADKNQSLTIMGIINERT